MLFFIAFVVIAVVRGGNAQEPIHFLASQFLQPPQFQPNPGTRPLSLSSFPSHSEQCMPQKGICPLQCQHGYKIDNRGCEFCQCADQASFSGAKTSMPTTTQLSGITISPVQQQTQSPPDTSTIATTTDNTCTVADTICRLKCPSGYFVDPNDCTNCVCKSDVLHG